MITSCCTSTQHKHHDYSVTVSQHKTVPKKLSVQVRINYLQRLVTSTHLLYKHNCMAQSLSRVTTGCSGKFFHIMHARLSNAAALCIKFSTHSTSWAKKVSLLFGNNFVNRQPIFIIFGMYTLENLKPEDI